MLSMAYLFDSRRNCGAQFFGVLVLRAAAGCLSIAGDRVTAFIAETKNDEQKPLSDRVPAFIAGIEIN
jgi:hypothetical protein